TQLPACYAAEKQVMIKHAAGHDIPRYDEFGRNVAEAITAAMDKQAAVGTVARKERNR
ncbi:hypothetical protein HK105_209530, partial [Polyrhizophydium stewartii]